MELETKAVMLDELKKIGLSENEAKVYLALLELGSEPAQEVAKKSEVKRATTYVQLEALMKLGLVTSFEKPAGRNGGGTKTFFRAEDPEHLIKIAEREKKLARERETALDEILPGLSKLYLSSGERPRVRFFEGIEGVKTMLSGTFQIKTNVKEILGVTDLDSALQVFPKLTEEYTPARVKHGLRSRVIYTGSEGASLSKTDAEMLRESRFLPKNKFPFSGDMSIYGDEVVISAIKSAKPFGIIIESKEIANSLRAVFELAWQGAEAK